MKDYVRTISEQRNCLFFKLFNDQPSKIKTNIQELIAAGGPLNLVKLSQLLRATTT